MLLQYFLIISSVYCVVIHRNFPDSWNLDDHSSPLQREDWRNAFERGFKDFCRGRGGAENLTYEVSQPLFNLLKRHVDGYSNTTVFRGYYYRVGFGYNPIYYLDYYPNAFANYISRHTHEDANYTCQVERVCHHRQ
ncbi:unnamed protein product [Cylicocyclus nassatus]|uniref:Uncharacterized protein n=1 Tax=Cylicocyclus nassatus TaxID=53992 RepID=A0AA36GFH8_CYLNA|nr:unnamed protein product [Cylicocyclus nassatus]